MLGCNHGFKNDKNGIGISFKGRQKVFLRLKATRSPVVIGVLIRSL
jgi:hypothetical protein